MKRKKLPVYFEYGMEKKNKLNADMNCELNEQLLFS